MSSSKSQLISFVKLLNDSVVSWAVGKVCEVMLQSIAKIEELDKKLDRVLEEPYVTGKNTLDLAQRFHNKGNYLLRDKELERAMINFDKAGGLLTGLEQIHAYCLAALCGDLLKDKYKDEGYKEHYLDLAYTHLLSFEELLNNANKNLGKGRKLGIFLSAGASTMGVVALTVATAAVNPLIPIMAITMPVVNIIYLLKMSTINQDKLPVFDCSISELKKVLKKRKITKLILSLQIAVPTVSPYTLLYMDSDWRTLSPYPLVHRYPPTVSLYTLLCKDQLNVFVDILTLTNIYIPSCIGITDSIIYILVILYKYGCSQHLCPNLVVWISLLSTSIL